MQAATEPGTVVVIGAGTMGQGIAQLAAVHDHPVILFDTSETALRTAKENLRRILFRQAEKGKPGYEEPQAILDRVDFRVGINGRLPESIDLVIEAVPENLEQKQAVLQDIETYLPARVPIATNTSSLSVTALGTALAFPKSFLGMHFFNPVPLMPLVELVPTLATEPSFLEAARNSVERWGKTVVVAQDTPGFIVNRIARHYYGEALRIVEEGMAGVAEVDAAMTAVGGFPMGPFELMDFIGNDVNLAVSETIYRESYFEPRFRPSLLQKRYVQSGRLGRKSGQGFYEYDSPRAPLPAVPDRELAHEIFMRIFVMIVNEAIDVVARRIATPEDVDLAMQKGVNYPKGPLRWAEELGLKNVLDRLDALRAHSGERYQAQPLLRSLVLADRKIYDISRSSDDRSTK